MNNTIERMERNLQILDRVMEISLMTFVAFSMFSISITQISCAIGGFAWLAKVHLTRTWGQVKTPLGLVFLLFVLACIVSVLTAVDMGKSYKPLKKLLEIGIFFWAVNTIRDEEQREFLFKLLIVSASVAALYGFYQAFLSGVSKATRVEGTMSIYMTFAGILMLAALMALSRLLFRRPPETWLAAVIVLLVACLLLTLTRQAWLGLALGALFLAFVREKKLLIAMPILMALIVAVSPGAVRERLLSLGDLKDQTLATRLTLWRGGWEIFKDHPLTGCGFKCVDTVYPLYPEQAPTLKRYKGMHNNMIQLAVDTGILGLGAWLAIWAGYFQALCKLRRNRRDDSSRWIALGSAAVTIGFLGGGIFEVNFYDSEVVMLLYFLMGLPFAAQKQAERGEPESLSSSQ